MHGIYPIAPTPPLAFCPPSYIVTHMTIAQPPADHPPFPSHSKTGILLVNLGSPAAATKHALRAYLKQFLWDRRVIELPRWWWWLILHTCVLPSRPAKSATAYTRIWGKNSRGEIDLNDPDGAPLRRYTRAQANALRRRLTQHNPPSHFAVAWAMRYGAPSITSQLDFLTHDQHCNRLIIFPLYPQYAAATTASVQDEVLGWMLGQRWQPAVRFVAPWHDHAVYIKALADSVKKALPQHDKSSIHLLASFHGIPERYFAAGDPYHCQCMKTARLVREALSWSPSRFHVAFQSRFGREAWLQPYTDATIAALAKQGVKHLAVIAPGFVSDCLETLDELGNEGRADFLAKANDGGQFTYIPALNASAMGMGVLETLLHENSRGWLR